jgi:hypothetical protein
MVFTEIGGPRRQNTLRGPQKGPHFGVTVLGRRWTSVDDNQRSPTRNIRNFRVICAIQWTFSDVLEGNWMVGRVGLEPTTN